MKFLSPKSHRVISNREMQWIIFVSSFPINGKSPQTELGQAKTEYRLFMQVDLSTDFKVT